MTVHFDVPTSRAIGLLGSMDDMGAQEQEGSDALEAKVRDALRVAEVCHTFSDAPFPLSALPCSHSLFPLSRFCRAPTVFLLSSPITSVPDHCGLSPQLHVNMHLTKLCGGAVHVSGLEHAAGFNAAACAGKRYCYRIATRPPSPFESRRRWWVADAWQASQHRLPASCDDCALSLSAMEAAAEAMSGRGSFEALCAKARPAGPGNKRRKREKREKKRLEWMADKGRGLGDGDEVGEMDGLEDMQDIAGALRNRSALTRRERAISVTGGLYMAVRFYQGPTTVMEVRATAVAPEPMMYHSSSLIQSRITPLPITTFSNPSPRTLTAVLDEGSGDYTIEIRGTGFKFGMCRVIAAAVVEAGAGRLSVDTIRECVDGAKTLPVKPAPPHGLTLEEVMYDRGESVERG